MKTPISYKQFFIFFIVLFTAIKIAPSMFAFILSKVQIPPYFLLLILLIFVSLLFIIRGVLGFFTKKHYPLGLHFNYKYEAKNNKIYSEEKSYTGVLGATRSVLHILIGLCIFMIVGFILYSIFIQR